jgi:hypothetical protein
MTSKDDAVHQGTGCRASGWAAVGYLAVALWCVFTVAWGQPWEVVVGIATAAFMAWIAGAAAVAWAEDRR